MKPAEDIARGRRAQPGAGGGSTAGVVGLYPRGVSEEPDPRVAAARRVAFVLYEGERTPHRSCGICLAETFGRATAAYQALRRGGITGLGECGALKAGELVLGELLGDPDPTGPVTSELRRGLELYRAAWRARLAGLVGRDLACNSLTSGFGDFAGTARREFCTTIASEAAAAVATALAALGVPFDVAPEPPDPAPPASESSSIPS